MSPELPFMLPEPLLPEFPELPEEGLEGTLLPLLVEQPPVQPVMASASTSAATVSRTANRFIFISSFTCFLWIKRRQLSSPSLLRG